MFDQILGGAGELSQDTAFFFTADTHHQHRYLLTTPHIPTNKISRLVLHPVVHCPVYQYGTGTRRNRKWVARIGFCAIVCDCVPFSVKQLAADTSLDARRVNDCTLLIACSVDSMMLPCEHSLSLLFVLSFLNSCKERVRNLCWCERVTRPEWAWRCTSRTGYGILHRIFVHFLGSCFSIVILSVSLSSQLWFWTAIICTMWQNVFHTIFSPKQHGWTTFILGVLTFKSPLACFVGFTPTSKDLPSGSSFDLNTFLGIANNFKPPTSEDNDNLQVAFRYSPGQLCQLIEGQHLFFGGIFSPSSM